jgi:ectoine hydroxylase-related dioxygenase (phytanoyl-CoA dioxygenase family)
MRVLDEGQLADWHENGYVIVPEAAPPELLQAVAEAIWAFQEMDPDDPETWYRPQAREIGMPELNGAGMVEMYHHPAMWAVRQLPRIHGAFADIWGTEKLWVSIDRVNLNVPNRPGFEFRGFIHWDIDTSADPLPVDVQGVLSLSDSGGGRGGFQCVAGMPKRLEEWIATQPPDRDPYRPDTTGLTITEVETRAGDLLIWNSRVPHGVHPNTSERPRLAQYVSMSPAREDDEALRQGRIRAWLHRSSPAGDVFPGDPREWERRHGTTAALTPLGRRLLGLDLWEPSDDRPAPHAGPSELRESARTGATPGFAT